MWSHRQGLSRTDLTSDIKVLLALGIAGNLVEGSARMNRPETSRALYKHWCTSSDLTLPTVEDATLFRPIDSNSLGVTFGTL